MCTWKCYCAPLLWEYQGFIDCEGHANKNLLDRVVFLSLLCFEILVDSKGSSLCSECTLKGLLPAMNKRLWVYKTAVVTIFPILNWRSLDTPTIYHITARHKYSEGPNRKTNSVRDIALLSCLDSHKENLSGINCILVTICKQKLCISLDK